MSAKLVEKRNELKAKQQEMSGILEKARNGDTYDFSKITELDGDTSEAKVEAFQAKHRELEDLATEVNKLSVEEKAVRVEAIGRQLSEVGPSAPQIPDGMRHKSLGEMFVESEGFKEFHRSRGEIKTVSAHLDIDAKALMATTQGWAPESTRIARIAEAPTRPIQILDLVPDGTTDQASVVYMEETLRGHNAAERAEGAQYSEDGFELVERTSQVRSIGTSLPITDEQLEDVGQIQSYIDNRLRFSALQRLDSQLLNGNGTAPNLRGILATVGVQTQAKGSLPTFDAVHYAMTKVRTIGRAFPNGISLHPMDWQDIRLTRTADGIYILGNPAEPGPMTLFGLQVTLNDAIAENTGLVGDFANHCQRYTRKGVTIEVGYVNNQFNEGKRTLRATTRVAFVVYRPSAFCTVTGI